MAELHLYEFGDAGFYVAVSKSEAFRIYNHDAGSDEAESDFKREVPDDELIAVHSDEESWDDPREYLEVGKAPDPPRIYWVLKVTAREWANELTHGNGYVFGGDC